MNEREQKAFNMLEKSAACLLKSTELVKESPTPGILLRVAFNAGAKSMLDAWEYLNGGDLPEWYASLCEAVPDQVDAIGADQEGRGE